MAETLPADLKRIDPADAWKPWAPSAAEPWDRKRIAHLYRRAAFGATPLEVDQALARGYSKTLEQLSTGTPRAEELSELFLETGRDCDNPTQLRNWWLYLMTQGGHPLREKMSLFWHNHFATSHAKVQSTRLMFEQNLKLRTHALGKFRPFLLAMSQDPAMLVWLDCNRNIAIAPNENYARELMELFSLGVGHYSEQDIREAARAFTGWHTDNEVEGEAFSYRPDQHDAGLKTIFGQTGNWNGDDVVRLCCDQPACAQFLVGKLYAFLVSETPPPRGLLTPLEERFRKTDYDIADLVTTMLGSRFFFSPHAYRKRVKWPVEFVLEAIHAATPHSVPNSDLLDPLAKMGQLLFTPPNVKGWRTGTDWLNSATLLARNNFAETVALGRWSRPSQTEQNGRRPKKAENSREPDNQTDSIAILYASQPKTARDLLIRASELLYGERISARILAKLEKFLGEPPAPTVPVQTSANLDQSATGTKISAPSTAVVAPQPRPKAQAGSEQVEPDLQSPAIKARIREILHAMMCLPEYQTN